MALEKNILSPANVDAKYHRITNLRLDPKEGIELTVNGYKDEPSRVSLKAPLVSFRFFVSKDEFKKFFKTDAIKATPSDALVTASYQWLKTQKDFVGAVDC